MPQYDMLSVSVLCVVMRSVIQTEYAEWHSAECRYAESRGASPFFSEDDIAFAIK
jgi:hypothetical protein